MLGATGSRTAGAAADGRTAAHPWRSALGLDARGIDDADLVLCACSSDGARLIHLLGPDASTATVTYGPDGSADLQAAGRDLDAAIHSRTDTVFFDFRARPPVAQAIDMVVAAAAEGSRVVVAPADLFRGRVLQQAMEKQGLRPRDLRIVDAAGGLGG